MASLIESSLLALAQLALVFLFAPLLVGVMRKVKAVFQGRRGSPVWQPYFDLRKLFSKGTVSSKHSSWISAAAPAVNFAAVVVAALAVPVAGAQPALAMDLITFAYVLALGRFLIALSGLDAASAFGGIGSSREMLFATLIEPAFFMLVVFVFSLGVGGQIQPLFPDGLGAHSSAAAVLGAIALGTVILAELGRLPFDNPATHLELTMVHEAMILEASGPRLAFIEWAQSAKAFAFFALFSVLFLPVSAVSGALQFLQPFAYPLSILIFVFILGIITASFESFTPKIRLFRVPALLVFALCCAALALLASRFNSRAVPELVVLLGFVMLLASFYIMIRAKFSRRVEVYLFQSAALSLVFLWVALQQGNAAQWIEFGATVVFKLLLFPYLLLRSMNAFYGKTSLGIDFDPITLNAPIHTPGAMILSLAAVFGAFVFSSVLDVQNVLLPIALSIIFIGVFVIAVKSHLLLQVLGFLILENGLVLLPLTLSVEMPILGTIAAFFDLLVMVVVFVVLIFKIQVVVETLDSQKLNLLRE